MEFMVRTRSCQCPFFGIDAQGAFGVPVMSDLSGSAARIMVYRYFMPSAFRPNFVFAISVA